MELIKVHLGSRILYQIFHSFPLYLCKYWLLNTLMKRHLNYISKNFIPHPIYEMNRCNKDIPIGVSSNGNDKS